MKIMIGANVKRVATGIQRSHGQAISGVALNVHTGFDKSITKEPSISFLHEAFHPHSTKNLRRGDHFKNLR